MLLIIGTAVIVLLGLLLMNWKRVALALLPLVFSRVSTLGTLKLIGHPIDIPGLLLAVVAIRHGRRLRALSRCAVGTPYPRLTSVDPSRLATTSSSMPAPGQRVAP